MFKLLLMIGLLAGLALAGCGASVDENGKVFSDRVWFDQHGVAHCPHPDCARTIALRPTLDESDKSRVLPVEREEGKDVGPRAVCENKHPVHWGTDIVVCWQCDGAARCTTCRGTGQVGKGLVCSGCVNPGDTKGGSGWCAECDGKGTMPWSYGGKTVIVRN